jgi:hypothetical protein
MSILRRITDKFGAMRQRSKDKKEFLESILSAAEDGKLSDSEVTELQTRLKELELTDEDIRIVRVQAYNAALHAAKRDGRISSEEEAELEKLQKFLRIPGYCELKEGASAATALDRDSEWKSSNGFRIKCCASKSRASLLV